MQSHAQPAGKNGNVNKLRRIGLAAAGMAIAAVGLVTVIAADRVASHNAIAQSTIAQNTIAQETAPQDNAAGQDDYFYVVGLTDLKLESEPPPMKETSNLFYLLYPLFTPRVVLDQAGEAWCQNDNLDDPAWSIRQNNPINSRLAIRVKRAGDITGTLYLPNADFTGQDAYRFTLPVDGKTQQPRSFYMLKADYYAGLRRREIPGAAWYRLQEQEARAQAGLEPNQAEEPNRRFNARGLDDTFELFSGGRAISENLALDRELRTEGSTAELADVPVSDIRGVTIREFDWTKLNQGINPRLDPLASHVPHDQHALFFPTFNAVLQAVDTSDAYGTLAIYSMEPRAEDARTKDRYQRQLCLEASQLSRILGPSVIRSVAVTGSDPYLRTGSDVAVLFEAIHPTTLLTFVRAKQAAAMQVDKSVKAVSGDVDGLKYEGVISADRSVCSLMARLDDVIVVTNSLAQLKQLAAVKSGQQQPLAALPEYAFMRNRYPLGSNQETAFVMLSDATIRRWCSPRWRITNSRRTRAAAALAQLTAEMQDRLLTEDNLLEQLQPYDQLGRTLAMPGVVQSSTFNTLKFMTPIAEIGLTKVTKTEREAYERWRDGYERQWQGYFDPIAVQVSLADERLAADLTVMPMIGGSEYMWLRQFSQGMKLSATGADRHDGAIAQIAMGLSPNLRQLSTYLGIPATAVGDNITAYVDFDEEFAKQALVAIQEMGEGKTPTPIRDPPLAIRLALKTNKEVDFRFPFVGGQQPKEPKTRTYRDQKITFQLSDPSVERVETAVLPTAVIVATNKNTMNAAIDRELNRAAGKDVPTTRPEWLGESLGVQVDQRAWELLDGLVSREAIPYIRLQSWGNLPILNEWKARYPDRDPVEVHEEIWGTRLICPAGGQYVWNEKWQTMESTAAGHPGEPKSLDLSTISPLRQYQFGNFGLTFENDGVRGRAELLLRRPEEGR